MITTVISDLGNVLLHCDSGLAHERMGRLAGKTPAEIRKIIYTDELEHALNKGMITPQQYYERCRQALGLKCGYRRFVDAWVDIFTPNEDVISGLRKLKDRYRLALLSNINVLHFEHVEQKFPDVVGVSGLFDLRFLSYKLKMRKPEPGIFVAALHGLQEKPEACLFIDDKQKNVDVAKSLGMRAETYLPHTDFEALLRQHGVLV